MSKILQINYKFSVTRDEHDTAVSGLAGDIATIPGLRWKVWLMNEAESEAGGIYLFEDAASVNAFVEGPIVAQVVKHPALSGFVVKHFDVSEDLTALTRGPV